MKLELQGFTPELNAIQCGLRINRSYEHLLNAHTWSFLFTEALVKLYAPITAGTATAVNGSNNITGTGTTWTSAVVGRYIKIGSSFTFYRITGLVVLTQVLTIESTFGEANVTDGAYTIFQDVYSKPTDCGNIVSIRYDLNIGEVTKAYVDTLDPDRESTGEPWRWYNIDDATFGIWPVPDQAYTVRMQYRKAIAQLSAEADAALLPERLILKHAQMAAYQQLAGSEQGAKTYGQLYVALAQEKGPNSFGELWLAAVEEDMRKLSLPTNVRNVDGLGLPTNDTWNLSHDREDPRR